jgi:hypothetical protein
MIYSVIFDCKNVRCFNLKAGTGRSGLICVMSRSADRVVGLCLSGTGDSCYDVRAPRCLCEPANEMSPSLLWINREVIELEGEQLFFAV